MKPAPFDYVRPTSVDDAVRLLHGSGGDGKVLAGGQSLVPLMNFRLAAPSLLVDLNGVSNLAYIRPDGDRLSIGPLTRMRHVERDATVRSTLPLLSEAASWVGHVQIRNRGTFGGSLAHADPAAEMPAVALLLDASLTVAGPTGVRTIAAADFFLGFLTTALADDEILTDITLRIPSSGSGWGFQEFAQRHGDFALAGAAVVVSPGEMGRVERASIVVFGGPDAPLRAAAAEAALIGESLTVAVIEHAAALATQVLDEDPRADTAYRRRLTETMVSRALADAGQRRDDA
ncbi:MAG TPA: xanthine dehydrogenase family protein subunit M [Candidatus Deferrimicrobium sp.]|nr:xanthine dehydrogenase family protein subunit M [Candidatus Deferrimicrobium sp.]